jgi:catechol-2,3-dioxygenase
MAVEQSFRQYYLGAFSMLKQLYLDHLVFRVGDLAATRAFYELLFGEPLYQSEDSFMYLVGLTRLFFTVSLQEKVAPYDKEKPGLNHLAFGVDEPAALRAIGDHLDGSGIAHSGIRVDQYGKKEFIWLDDPNGFRVEFYCRPAPAP